MREMTAERLREVLDYNPETGEFRWRISPSSQVRAGSVAGSIDKRHGYILIGLFGRLHFAHRLVWLYMTGAWPINRIDHVNSVKGDNRFANLRDVTQRMNVENVLGPRSDNTSGYLGVYRDRTRGGWKSEIKVNGQRKFLGRFSDPESAYAVYLAAKRAHHKGNTL